MTDKWFHPRAVTLPPHARARGGSRTQVREPVNAGGLGRWRACENQLQPLIAALAEGDALPKE